MGLDHVNFSGGPRERVLQALIDAGYRVTAIFINDPDRWPKIKPTVDLATAHSIPVRVVKTKAELSTILPEIAGKNCLSAGFNYLVPQSLLAKVGMFLNVHGSLLPKYAGRTLPWA